MIGHWTNYHDWRIPRFDNDLLTGTYASQQSGKVADCLSFRYVSSGHLQMLPRFEN